MWYQADHTDPLDPDSDDDGLDDAYDTDNGGTTTSELTVRRSTFWANEADEGGDDCGDAGS